MSRPHREWRLALGLTVAQEARLLGVGVRTVQRWDRSPGPLQGPLQGPAGRLLALLELRHVQGLQGVQAALEELARA